MRLFKLIEIDLAAERNRIKNVKFNLRQKLALFELCDLFEAGKWQECLDHIEKNFPYNEKGEYDETEHISIAMSNILQDLAYSNYFTRDQLLQQVKEIIAQENLLTS